MRFHTMSFPEFLNLSHHCSPRGICIPPDESFPPVGGSGRKADDLCYSESKHCMETVTNYLVRFGVVWHLSQNIRGQRDGRGKWLRPSER